MKPLHDYPEADLKLVYRVLQTQLQAHPDLLDSPLLEELQDYLQRRAQQDGIDLSYHPAWAAWLRNEEPPPPPTGPRLKLVRD